MVIQIDCIWLACFTFSTGWLAVWDSTPEGLGLDKLCPWSALSLGLGGLDS